MNLQYPYDTPPESGAQFEVAEGIFWLRFPLPFQLNHVNLWCLRDGNAWTLIDTGYANAATERLWATILPALNAPLKRLIVTHFHPDHIGLAAWLQHETGASLHMSCSEFLMAHALWHGIGSFTAEAMVEQFRQHGLSEPMRSALSQRGNVYRKSIAELPLCYERLDAQTTLTINDEAWQVLIGHGHSPEHVMLYAPQRDILISGDMLLPRISTNISVFAATPHADALGGFLATLHELAQRINANTLILPSHGLPFRGALTRIAELNAHHAERLQRVLTHCQGAPHSAADLLAPLFERTLDLHQTMFAMGEAIAHLNYLAARGEIHHDLIPQNDPRNDHHGIIRFAR